MFHGSSKSPERTPIRVIVNGRSYRWPVRPTVVVCFDGCDPTYIVAARRAGCVPTITRMMSEGYVAEALAVMPTFTNPNNISIVCGASPAVHGVSGNYYLDRTTGRNVMVIDDSPMRAETILARFSQEGANVAAITAKDKLRKALARGLRGVAFSAECVSACTEAEHGIAAVPEFVGRPAPDQYSPELSLFVLDAGLRLLTDRHFDLIYLSLSDYVQHKHAPSAPEALDFMHEVDRRLAAFLELNAVIGVVADHGMTDMAIADGQPNVIYLGDHLDAEFGAGTTRVICPITDPFVRHHGALGGFVRVHLTKDGIDRERVRGFLAGLPGIQLALSREEACARFELPDDREGDIAVVGQPGTAIGARAIDHDVSQLAGERLRSHGSLAEQNVPFIVSHSLSETYVTRASSAPLRNYDIFDFVLNGVQG